MLNPPLFSVNPIPTPKRQDKEVQSTVFLLKAQSGEPGGILLF